MNLKLNPIGANQTTIETEDLTVLFSYKTPVACVKRSDKSGKFEFFKTNKKWSKTTSRHINRWLDGQDAKEKEQEFFDNLIK